MQSAHLAQFAPDQPHRDDRRPAVSARHAYSTLFPTANSPRNGKGVPPLRSRRHHERAAIAWAHVATTSPPRQASHQNIRRPSGRQCWISQDCVPIHTAKQGARISGELLMPHSTDG